MEMRDDRYKSPTDVDDHSQFLYAYDDFADEYGWMTKENFLKLYQDIRGGEFPYNIICIDNLAMLQGLLMSLIQDAKSAKEIARAVGLAYQENRLFLDHRFKPTDAGGIYTLLKSIIKWFLMTCKRAKVDVISTTESKNVWVNYGSKNAKILGRTTKALDPWIQLADLCLLLNRTKGSREAGTAQLVGPPEATMDPFNPKHSLPGVPVSFTLDNWENFWEKALSRTVPTAEDWATVQVDKAETPEYAAVAIEGPSTEDEAKTELADLAVQHDWMTNSKDAQGAATMIEEASKKGLGKDEMLSRYDEWVAFIKETKSPGKAA
jgi:hypothetical protein